MGVSKKIMGITGLILMFFSILYFIVGLMAGQGAYVSLIFGIPAFILLYLSNKKNKPKEDSVLEALKMRYVNGEITKDEFEEKKQELTKDDE